MLPAAIRFKLHHGPYRTPRFKFGATVKDEIRGKVKIIGISDARIPWPLAHYWARRSVVVYRGLAKAIRRESVQAVAYWFGISVDKVRLARRALGVPIHNGGTHWLRKRLAETPEFRRMARKAWATAGEREPNRGMLGKSHPKSVRRRISRSLLGRVQSAASLRKRSQSLKRNGSWRHWTADETALLSLPIHEVAERTGRTLVAIRLRRRKLGIA
jgi:hypothetical protein